MKKINFLLFCVVISIVLCGCNTDPIHNGDPVDPSFGMNFPLEEFHRLGEAGDTVAQMELVKKHKKQLTANVVRKFPSLKNKESIRFVLGSGLAKDVLTGSGKKLSGEFKNELVIMINDSTVQDTLFLACGNGMLQKLFFRDYHDLGTAEQWRFTIEKGEGLAHHLSDIHAWVPVARDFPVRIKDKNGNVVPPERCLKEYGYWRTLLFPGDVIDMANGKAYNKLGQEIDFDRRQAETQKANQKLAKRKLAKQKKDAERKK